MRSSVPGACTPRDPWRGLRMAARIEALGVVWIALLAIGASGTVAQAVDGGVPSRLVRDVAETDCRLAAQVLTHGEPAGKRDWALDIIQSCPQAKDVIPRLWSDVPTDDEEIEGLFHLSRQVRDGRIYEAAYSIATDPARQPLLRVVALGVLGSYVVPDLYMHLPLEPVTGSEPLRYNNIWSRIDHWSQRDGSVPFPADAEERIHSLVADLADPEKADTREPELFAAACWLEPHAGPALTP